MKLDLNFKFKDLDGNEINDENNKPAKIMSSLLVGNTPGINPSKAFIWANDFWKVGYIDVDKVDLEAIEKFVNASVDEKKLMNIGAHPILEAIKKAKEGALH